MAAILQAGTFYFYIRDSNGEDHYVFKMHSTQAGASGQSAVPSEQLVVPPQFAVAGDGTNSSKLLIKFQTDTAFTSDSTDHVIRMPYWWSKDGGKTKNIGHLNAGDINNSDISGKTKYQDVAFRINLQDEFGEYSIPSGVIAGFGGGKIFLQAYDNTV